MLTGKSHETPIDVEVRDEGARRQTVLQAGTKVQEAEELQCNNKVEASTLFAIREARRDDLGSVYRWLTVLKLTTSLCYLEVLYAVQAS